MFDHLHAMFWGLLLGTPTSPNLDQLFERFAAWGPETAAAGQGWFELGRSWISFGSRAPACSWMRSSAPPAGFSSARRGRESERGASGLSVLGACLAAHYVWALCWPASSKGRAGGSGRRVREARDRTNPGNNGAQVFKVGAENHAIKSAGLYVTMGPWGRIRCVGTLRLSRHVAGMTESAFAGTSLALSLASIFRNTGWPERF